MKKVQMKRVSLANAKGKTLPRNLSTHTQTVARVLFSSAPIYKYTPTQPHLPTPSHIANGRQCISVSAQLAKFIKLGKVAAHPATPSQAHSMAQSMPCAQ